jgi:hypothetical protein
VHVAAIFSIAILGMHYRSQSYDQSDCG